MTVPALLLEACGSSSVPPLLPVLKWAGGKRWLAPLIAPSIRAYLHGTGGRYIEPCLGGGAVAFAVQPRRALLGDVEKPLVACYAAIASDPEAVFAYLSALVARGLDSNAYYRVRAHVPRPPAARAARLLYLNRLAFNGLYRCNRDGKFNVPYGRYASPRFPAYEHLRELGAFLARTLLHAGDFGSLVAAAGPGDVVVADPPYDGATFRSYSAAGFADDDQERLAQDLAGAARRGAAVVATNADTARVRDLYRWAELLPTAEPRSVAARGKHRHRAACLLITNNPGLVRSSDEQNGAAS